MITFITDVKKDETPFHDCIFSGTLVITDLDEKPMFSVIPPGDGWNDEALRQWSDEARTDDSYAFLSHGANAYLSGEWVGSTEV